MLPPHYHPNAVNYVVAILGNTTTYMYQENGARLVTEVLTPGHATIFPRASMHMMVNTGRFSAACDLFFPLPSPLARRTNATLHGFQEQEERAGATSLPRPLQPTPQANDPTTSFGY